MFFLILCNDESVVSMQMNDLDEHYLASYSYKESI